MIESYINYNRQNDRYGFEWLESIHRWYVVKCDYCGKRFELDCNTENEMDNPEIAVKKAGWFSEDNGRYHYCKDCYVTMFGLRAVHKVYNKIIRFS